MAIFFSMVSFELFLGVNGLFFRGDVKFYPIDFRKYFSGLTKHSLNGCKKMVKNIHGKKSR